MTATMNRVMNDMQTLSANEKGFVVQCMISSLDTKQDENSTKEWASIANKRYEDIKSKKVQTISWDEIKQKVGI